MDGSKGEYMPKKLTKTQVKRTLLKMNKDLGRMMSDRMQYPITTDVTLTVPKIIDISKTLGSALKRIK